MKRALLAAGIAAWVLAASGSPLSGQRSRPNVNLRAESAGWDQVLSSLIRAFDAVDVVALGEAHARRVDSDLRIRLVNHPDFPKKVRVIVVEFANSLFQEVLDRYIQGDDVPLPELQQVWLTTFTGARGPVSSVYRDFLSAVRDVNRRLPASQRVRVLAGEPAIDWTRNPSPADRQRYNELRTDTPVSHLRGAVKSGAKALVVYGSGHIWHGEGRITVTAERDSAMKVFVVDTLAPVSTSQSGPAFTALDEALRRLEATLDSAQRPVLASLARAPASRLIANPFYLGQAMLPPDATIGGLADAVVYFGRAPEAGALVP